MIILNILGIPDDNKVLVTSQKGSLKEASFVIDGNAPFLERLTLHGHTIVNVCVGGAVEGDLQLPKKPDLIFNSICNAETNSRALLSAQKMCDYFNVPVINPPKYVLETTRDKSVKALSSIEGLIVPKTLKITPRSVAEIINAIEQFGFGERVIFRSTGEHGGEGMTLIGAHEGYEGLVAFALDGREYYLIDYMDFAGKDGIYRKGRFFVIDGKAFPRHLIASNGWNVHAHDRTQLMDDPKHQKVEEEFLENGALDTLASEMAKRLCLDCFGVDFGIDSENRMVLFEANACMRLLSGGQNGTMSAVDRVFTAAVEMIGQKIQQRG